MTMPATNQPAPTDRNSVSASELVRQFGIWQEQAAREPVYVMHRGRARLVLTSVDLMNRLCAPREGAATSSVEHELLLDMMREPVVRLDADARITRLNPAGAAWLGHAERDAVDRTLVDMMGEALGGYCDALVRRACRFATIETAELPLGRHHMTVTIAPTAPGAMLVGVEHSVDEDARTGDGLRRSLGAAMAATGIGHCVVNLRGYIDESEAGLEAMSGLTASILESARFGILFSTGSRLAVSDALDHVLRDGSPRTVDAMLHRNRAEDLAVSVGLAAIRPRAAIEAAVAVIRARPG